MVMTCEARAQAKQVRAFETLEDQARLGPKLTGEMKRANPDFYEALLRRRNLAWADILTREMTQGPGVDLVNVGALHMVGDEGLPALMAQRGFSVTRLQ
jgi:uncharacterized protein YbaP (TraB family)